MTPLRLLPRYPFGAGLIRTKNLIAVGVGLRASLRQVRRRSSSYSSSSPSRSHPLSLPSTPPPRPPHTRQITHPPSSTRASTAWNSRIHLSPKPDPLGWRRHFATTRPTSSVTPAEGKTNNKKSDSTTKYVLAGLLLAGVTTLGSWLALNSTDADGNPRDILLEYAVGKPLNSRSFVPFTIISREQVSPTSFLITVRPKDARVSSSSSLSSFITQLGWPESLLPRFLTETHSNRAILQQAWEYGLWAVEFKQPQLQVAREYTPLPSAYGQEEQDLERGHLRFLIRKMEGGEVSTYLSRLGVGDIVELRGPHLGFDIHSRLGSDQNNRKVVFLAGGTGIAPALQVVRALLDNVKAHERPSVSIIWANRHRADCEGYDGSPSTLLEPQSTTENVVHGKGGGNPVISLLAEAKARHGDKLQYACTVDEEGSFITSKSVADVTRISPPSSSTTSSGRGFLFSSFWGSASSPVQSSPPAPTRNQGNGEDDIDSAACPYHSAKRLITTDGSEDSRIPTTLSSNEIEQGSQDRGGSINANANPGTRKVLCQCRHHYHHHHPGGEENEETQGGRNLLMVSGPEGFISTFAGPKLFANGKELQGPVRGVVGNELRKKDPGFWRDWLVLKM